MIVVKTKKGQIQYSNLEWNLAWIVVFVFGVIVGIVLKANHCI